MSADYSIVRRSREAAELLTKSRSIKQMLITLSLLFCSNIFAQDAIGKIKEGIKTVLGLIMGIAFIAGVIICMYGAKKKIDGEPGAYYAIVGGALLAMAPLIMGALYAAFGFSGMATSDVKW